ncbi:MAG: SPOR domain-containing protein, partial [Mariniphaga sp.]
FTSQFKTDEGKQLFEQGQALKRSLDEKINEVNRLREAYKNERNPETKAELGKKILTLETDSYSLKDEISRKFAAARKVENQYWSTAGSVAIYNFQIENEKIKSVLKGKKPDQQPTSSEEDSIVILPLAVSEIYESKSTGVSQSSGKLVYKIQIGAYSRGVPAYRQRLFDKLSLIRKIDNYTDENGVVVYTTGNLTSLEDAEKMLNQVRQEGIEDAIIAPYFNGKRITLEQAKKIEAGDDI